MVCGVLAINGTMSPIAKRYRWLSQADVVVWSLTILPDHRSSQDTEFFRQGNAAMPSLPTMATPPLAVRKRDRILGWFRTQPADGDAPASKADSGKAVVIQAVAPTCLTSD